MLLIYLALLSDPSKDDLFNEIYNTYRFKLYWCIEKILHNHHNSEDALQETFVHIAENIHKLSDVSSQNTKRYISTIAKNVAINMLTRDIQRNTHNNIDAYYDYKATEDVIKDLINKEKVNNLFECVNELPQKYQILFELYYMLGLGIKEIAEMNGEKRDTVKTRLVRMNKIIRYYMKERFGDDN